MKILIVEDDIAFGKMLHIYLSKKGYEVSLVTTGAEATPLFSDGSFDVLITDLQLPDTTGLQLLEIVKEKAPTTQVLLMTGYAEVSTAVDAMKKGALEYISKPFRPEELLMILENVQKPNDIKESTLASEIEVTLAKTRNK